MATKKAVTKVAKKTKEIKETKEKVKETPKSVKNGKIELPEDKQEIIGMFAQGKGDTGSPEVQVALLTYKIERLSQHLEENKKDNHSRRGLLKVIAKRRRILNYLQKLDETRYKGVIEKLGLKK